MAAEEVKARYQLKDENNSAILDDEGKPMWEEVVVSYDFGDGLDAAVELAGAESVFSNYRANARVALQGILRTKRQQGMDKEAIQFLVDGWRPGTVVEKTQVDPLTAVKNAFQTWSPEKRAEFLKSLEE